MTLAQEQEKTKAYQERIADCLQRGTEGAYRELQVLCEEPVYTYLLVRNKEFLLLQRIMRIWDREMAGGHLLAETIIGRTAAFAAIPYSALQVKQLIDAYTIEKFAFFRLEAGLPEELTWEGVERVLALGLTPESLILTAKHEAEDEARAIRLFAEALRQAEIRSAFPQAAAMEEVLRDYLSWRDDNG